MADPIGITILIGGAVIVAGNIYLFIRAYLHGGFNKKTNIRTGIPSWHITRAPRIELETPESLSTSTRYAGLPGNVFNLDRRLGK
jgi:hypothetical protein